MYESLEHQPRHPQPPRLQRLGSNNYGILEDCGRWLMAIPRDDVVALQQTPEYSEFLSAFERLGEVRCAGLFVFFTPLVADGLVSRFCTVHALSRLCSLTYTSNIIFRRSPSSV